MKNKVSLSTQLDRNLCVISFCFQFMYDVFLAKMFALIVIQYFLKLLSVS